MRNRILTLCFLVALGMGSNQAFAASAKVGQPCPKAGLKSGSLVCTKVGAKLVWQISKKSQSIIVSAPSQANIADKSVKFSFSATSKLAVTATSLTPTVCTVANSLLSLGGTPGPCRISLSQSGNAYFLPAPSKVIEVKVLGINLIDFELPGALLLSQGTFQLVATSSANLIVTFASSTPATCSVANATLTLLQAGTCTVIATQTGTDYIPAAAEVARTVEISTSRVTADLPDTMSGFQVKAIYVVPSDGVDNNSDTNGYIASILDEGNSYLNSQIGLTLQIDRSTTGYDIQYLKSSYSTEYLRTHEAPADSSTSDEEVLLNEIKAMDNPGDNRKDYIFFIEVPGFDAKYCGYASTPGMTAIVALQNVSDSGVCKGNSPPYFQNYTSKTWIHELMHNFGVDHTKDDPCDLMWGGDTNSICTAPTKYSMDKERTRYVGASVQGQDVTKLRVWKGYTDNQNLKADCLINPAPRQDGIQYAYCPTGTRAIGELHSCWNSITSVELQEMVAGVWTSLGTGNYYTKFWGGDLPNWKCSDPNYQLTAWKEVTVNQPGIRHYRWIVNGRVNEELNVIWVN